MPNPINQIGGSAAVALTTVQNLFTAAAPPSGAGLPRPSHCMITATGNGFRWRSDGTAVTSTTGQLIGGTGSGGTLSLMDPNFSYESVIARMSIISVDGSVTSTINVAYFAI